MDLSIVIPVYNEVESLPFLHQAVQTALKDMPRSWEVVYVNDGSKDGSDKVLGFPKAPPPEAPPLILWVAGPIELIGGILVMIGLFTRWTAFLCSGLMAAAYWMAHGMKALLPSLNGGELAVLYCFALLYIAARGAGIWSVDGARGEG